ncbi:MAG TPA: DUF1801 domain-containing protein [Bacteroidia bacterium]|nr:DUF1801 domain-containing protein [Bacteroidia bacterium]
MSQSASTRITAAYAKMPENIRAIVEKVRAIIHKAEPAIEENWKWGPAFEKNGLAMGLWGFKKHVSFVFYRGAEMSDRHKLFNDGHDNAHNRMIKFTSIKEVNEKKLADYVKEAVKLNASGAKKEAKTERKIDVPEELQKWFAKNKKAKTFFDGLSFTYKKEMTQFISGAKQQETRERRFKRVTESLKKGKKEIR